MFLCSCLVVWVSVLVMLGLSLVFSSGSMFRCICMCVKVGLVLCGLVYGLSFVLV